MRLMLSFQIPGKKESMIPVDGVTVPLQEIGSGRHIQSRTSSGLLIFITYLKNSVRHLALADLKISSVVIPSMEHSIKLLNSEAMDSQAVSSFSDQCQGAIRKRWKNPFPKQLKHQPINLLYFSEYSSK